MGSLMLITGSQLSAALPSAKKDSIDLYKGPLNTAMEEFGITTKPRIAAFLAQIGHESASLSKVVESTYYKDPARLLAIFPMDFDDLEDARGYVRNPENCANRIYANQNWNGDEASGDGLKYRGRVLIQVTGRVNYKECGEGIGVDLIEVPELLEEPLQACRSAAWFWKSRGCNELADTGNFGAITKKINGGYNGQKERITLYASAKKAFLA